jgi:hypothetical protein
MEYRFISGLDNSYSKSVRAHVLQRHLRDRRLRAEKRDRSKVKPDDDHDLALVRQRAEHFRRSNGAGSQKLAWSGNSRPVPEFSLPNDNDGKSLD